MYILLLFIVLKNVLIPKVILRSLGHDRWYVLILQTRICPIFWSAKCQNFMIFDSENRKYLEFLFGYCVVFWREKIFVVIMHKTELKLLKQFTDQKYFDI